MTECYPKKIKLGKMNLIIIVFITIFIQRILVLVYVNLNILVRKHPNI